MRGRFLALAVAAHASIMPLGDLSAAEQLWQAGSIWIVEYSGVAQEADIERGDIVFEAPMYPERLFRTINESHDTLDGRTIISANQQLIPHNLSNGQTDYCTTKDLGALQNGIFHCFVDQDANGSIDGYYRVLSRLLSGAPIVDSGKTGEFRALEPFEIEEMDTKLVENPLKLRVRWRSTDRKTGQMIFSVSLASQREKDLPFDEDIRAIRVGDKSVLRIPGASLWCTTGNREISICRFEPTVDRLRMKTMGTRVNFDLGV